MRSAQRLPRRSTSRRPRTCERLVSHVDDTFGSLDVLVTCAGVFHATPFDEITPDEWDRIQAVNLKGTFLACQAAVKSMIPHRKGRIVTVASLAGQVGGLAAGAAYAASKAGVVGLTKSVARFAGPHGITVNCVNPGVIDTPMITAWPPDVRDRTVGATPIGRVGTPEEVAAVVAWLASDASRVRPRRPRGRERRPPHGLVNSPTEEGTMAKEAKVCRGTWCMAFGFDPPAALDEVLPVLGAWGYDGVELGGFFDHATVERYPDKASRKKLKEHIDSLGLEIAGIAPGPYGDLFRLPWATGSQEVYDEYIELLRELPSARGRHGDPRHARRSRGCGAAAVRRRVRRDLGPGRADVPAPCGEGRRGRLRHALGARVAPAVQQAVGDGEDAERRRQLQLQAHVRHGPLPGLRRDRAQPRPARRDAAEPDRVHQDAARRARSATCTCATPT